MRARSDALDAVRGLAISAVVACHHFDVGIGRHGVDLFFVLSGFLIGGILIDNRDAKNYFTTFYARRAARILPLYWLYLAFVALTSGLIVPLAHFLIFAQTFDWVAQGAQQGAAAITWSLAVEEQFYMLLPPLIWVVRPLDLPKVLLACALAAPFLRVGLALVTGEILASTALLPGHLDTLCGGALLAWLTRQTHLGRKRFVPVWLAAAIGVAGLTGIAAVEDVSQDGLLMWSVGGSLMAAVFVGVVLAAALASGPTLPIWLRPLSLAGIGAYAIYISSDALSRYLNDRWLTVVATALFASVSWLLIERPCLRWARRTWRYEWGNDSASDKGSVG
jgi:peptidoglycan/LPS O-acetylase OafA/YrhL